VKFHFRPGTETTKQTDWDTVIEAREAARTPVTSNGDDFLRYTRQAQRKALNPRCQDCWGLVIIPNQDLVRESALEKAQVRRGIHLGNLIIPWKAIAYANLCVRIEREGKTHISRFERCAFCQRDFPIPAAWYQGLPPF